MVLSGLEDRITSAVEKVSESVVSITSTMLARDVRFGLVPFQGAGTGVIIDAEGYIITNNHVIDEANGVEVHLKDGRTLLGQVIGGDPATDIAVIRVEAEDLPAAQLSDSEKLKVGQLVLAVGNSLGLPGGHTVSMGVISALGRPLPGSDYIFEGLIQTDAAINPGNSGGPLADLDGGIVGINAAMIPFAQGVGFAIPINTVKRTSREIIQRGRVVRPWLGVSVASLDPAIARRYSLPVTSGVLVAEVTPQGPAYHAGLRAADILNRVGTRDIAQMKDLLEALAELKIGERVTLGFVRGGAGYETSLRLEEAPIQAIRPQRR